MRTVNCARGPVSVHLRRRTERPGIVQKFRWEQTYLFCRSGCRYLLGRFAVGDTCPRQPGSVTIPGTTIILTNRGDLYELLVWDRGSNGTRWARQVPTPMDSIMREFLPGHLYWLRDLTEGVEERIFTYEQGKQVWW